MVGTNRQGEVKNSIGNGEAKEFICMAHGHELRRGVLEGWLCRAEGDKGEKKEWGNYSSIINVTYLKRMNTEFYM